VIGIKRDLAGNRIYFRPTAQAAFIVVFFPQISFYMVGNDTDACQA
jgi:hypothetical protein